MTKNYLYFLKDSKTGLFWDGSYHYMISTSYGDGEKLFGWRKDIPRFFKKLSSLVQSLNRCGPKVFRQKTGKNRHFWDNQLDILWGEWRDFINNNKPNSIEILEEYKKEGYEIYQLEINKSLKFAKKI